MQTSFAAAAAFGASLPARIGVCLAIALIWLCATAGSALAGQNSIGIAAALSLTGPGDYYGKPILDGVNLAVDEANAADPPRRIELTVSDDQSDVGRARSLAQDICKTAALAEVGPALTISALSAGPAYAECGLAAIPATAHGDDVPNAATTFQPVFNGGAMGSSLAAYLKFVLGGQRAMILFREDGYGQSFAAGFANAAAFLSLPVTQHGFHTDAGREAAIQAAVGDPDHPAIALGMLNSDAVPILTALRREGVNGPVLAPSAIGGENFVEQFAAQPEEAGKKGYFTERVYAASPILFDSADAAVLAFAERFRKHYGREPSWPAVQGYDSARLAIAAALAQPDGASTDVARAGVRAYLTALNAPERAFAGVTGPIWFTADRHREQPVRVGLFHNGLFDSAPVQLVPVASPSRQDLQSGDVFEALPDRFVRRQSVVYTGIFVNDVPRLDLARSTFNVDFYLWMRFVEGGGPVGFDPTDIRFPGMIGGSFNRNGPSESRLLPDGTSYRLWHVEGEVRNEFDLKRFPFDRQTLRLSFFNSRADANRVVYVLDRASLANGGLQSLQLHPAAGSGDAAARRPDALAGAVVTPGAFRQLTQWQPVTASERRENLVTESPLGLPRTLSTDRTRELSGFVVGIRLERLTIATALKTLLPLMIMTVIMYASLYFPHGLVKEKVTVAITAALSGAVLLNSVNSQLGNIGYTIAAEYAFYVFFGLSLLCILSVLLAERQRGAGIKERALAIERWTKIAFVVAVAVVLGGAELLAAQPDV